MSKLAALLTLAFLLPAAASPVELVRDGRSEHVIWCEPDAPASVKLAAREIQRLVKASTGVELPLAQAPAAKMICLGDNPASRKAGVLADGLPADGFRVATKGDSVYVVGRDDADGKEKWKPHPGFFYFGLCVSRGTLFGAYAFLERALGVRWLMPGDVGEDVPEARGALAVPEMDLKQSPAFLNRTMYGVHNRRDDVREWFQRQRMGGSIAPETSHSFDQFPGIEALKGHPDWMPMRADGTRQPLFTGQKEGVYVTHKYCLSNPQFVRAFADSVVRYLEKDPNGLPPRPCAPISPSDGAGWCECPDCKKLVDRDTTGPFGDFGGRGFSLTPYVFGFYNEVAREVAKKLPDRAVGGFAYYEYLYPPVRPVKLEPALFVEVAVNEVYGYKFYQAARAERFQRLLRAWGKLTPNLGYTDYGIWMRDFVGGPLPPAPDLCRFLFRTLRESGVKAIKFTGTEAWGYGAALNYMVARLMWDPALDPEGIYREFLERAYGPAAAPSVGRIYEISEKALRAWINSKAYPDHEVDAEAAAAVFAPNMAEYERLYRAAFDAPKGPKQQKRLEMLGDNLVMLHANLRGAGLLKDPEASMFFRPDAEYERFLASRMGGIAIVNLERHAEGQKRYGRTLLKLWSPEKRKVAVPRLPAGVAAPTIDGKLDDPAWKSAGAADAFRVAGAPAPAKRQTTVRLACDAKALYLAFECEEPQPARLRKACAARDGAAIFSDDTVEFFFATGERVANNFWHVAINPANTVWDGMVADAQYHLDLRSAAAAGEKSWCVEVAIPWESLHLEGPPQGGAWKGNFGRVSKAAEPPETSTWSSVERHFLVPEAFGDWEFPKP
jgi:hypothetical protein